jgi:maltodextrin utilization protein YvdJ
VLIAALFNVANPVANVVSEVARLQFFETVILIALIAAVVIVPVNVGESDKTTDAVPVSSAKAEAKSADVNE